MKIIGQMSQIVACRMRGMLRRNILHAEARDYCVSDFYENVLWESYRLPPMAGQQATD